MPKPVKPPRTSRTGHRQSKSYRRARRALERGDESELRALARNRAAPPEVLYFIAERGSPEARRQVAANRNTPHQADALLIEDASGEVRIELARKIARLMPGLGSTRTGELSDTVLSLLERLARDRLPAVRAIIAEEIKASPKVPKRLVVALARDEASEVAIPVLEYSPLLGDDDLCELLAVGVAEGGIAAIARRRELSSEIADRIVLTLDIPAIKELLVNHSTQIREATMQKIVDAAENAPDLHEAIVDRPNLSMRVMKRVAGFVASALVQRLVRVNGLEPQEAEILLSRTRKKIDSARPLDKDNETLQRRAKQLEQSGAINDAFIADQIAKRRRTLLVHCLARKADIESDVVKRILESGNARAVTALADRCGLTMRTAIVMQGELALIPAKKRLNAKEGIDYPLTKAEMARELDFFRD